MFRCGEAHRRDGHYGKKSDCAQPEHSMPRGGRVGSSTSVRREKALEVLRGSVGKSIFVISVGRAGETG